MLRLAVTAAVLAALAHAPLAAAQAPPPLAGPPGASASKVLVIGTDGTRIDLVQRLIAAGEAPNLAAIERDGFLVPSLLAYTPPAALTLSEVGWSSIATGVWPAKHGVLGYFLNSDPGQATKNGYPDFLTRIERERPQLSTFLASNWSNIGMHLNGGPIFGDGIDARYAVAAPSTIDGWDRADQEVADIAAAYLRDGDPDAGFVYLGIVDEVAHLDGSANLRYLQAIRDTDRRIGELLEAVRARPTYQAERWAILLTTDHGQQNLTSPSVLSHGGGSALERTSFVGATGFGVEHRDPSDARVVDIAPTVFARLGIAVEPSWLLDGKALAPAAPAPPPVATARARGRTLTLTVSAPQGAAPIRAVELSLPPRITARSARAGAAARVTISRPGRRVTARARDDARRLRLTVRTSRPAARARLRMKVTDAAGARTAILSRAR